MSTRPSSWSGYVWCGTLVAAIVALGIGAEELNGSAAKAASIGVYVVIAIGAGTGVWAILSQKELERLIAFQATMGAFFAVLATALILGALEEIASRPPASAWTYWNVGWVTWVLLTFLLKKLRT